MQFLNNLNNTFLRPTDSKLHMRRSVENVDADTQALPAFVELVDQTAEWGRGPSVPRISSPIHQKYEPLASRRQASRPWARYSSVTSGLMIGLPSWWATPNPRNFMASSWMLGAIEPSMALHPGSAGEKDALQDRGVRHPRLADVEHNVDRSARLKYRKANAADLLGRRGSTTAATWAPRASLSLGPRRTALATPAPARPSMLRRAAGHAADVLWCLCCGLLLGERDTMVPLRSPYRVRRLHRRYDDQIQQRQRCSRQSPPWRTAIPLLPERIRRLELPAATVSPGCGPELCSSRRCSTVRFPKTMPACIPTTLSVISQRSRETAPGSTPCRSSRHLRRRHDPCPHGLVWSLSDASKIAAGVQGLRILRGE